MGSVWKWPRKRAELSSSAEAGLDQKSNTEDRARSIVTEKGKNLTNHRACDWVGTRGGRARHSSERRGVFPRRAKGNHDPRRSDEAGRPAQKLAHWFHESGNGETRKTKVLKRAAGTHPERTGKLSSAGTGDVSRPGRAGQDSGLSKKFQKTRSALLAEAGTWKTNRENRGVVPWSHSSHNSRPMCGIPERGKRSTSGLLWGRPRFPGIATRFYVVQDGPKISGLCSHI